MPYDEAGVYSVTKGGRRYEPRFVPPNCCICGKEGAIVTPTGAFICIEHSSPHFKEIMELALDKIVLIDILSDVVETVNKELECPCCHCYPIITDHRKDCLITKARNIIQEMQK